MKDIAGPKYKIKIGTTSSGKLSWILGDVYSSFYRFERNENVIYTVRIPFPVAQLILGTLMYR
jgi:hypothetical protein